MKQNRHSVLAFPKFNKEMSIWHQSKKHFWSYFAIGRIRLHWSSEKDDTLGLAIGPSYTTCNLNPKPRLETVAELKDPLLHLKELKTTTQNSNDNLKAAGKWREGWKYSSLKQKDRKSTKREKRHKYVKPVEATGLESLQINMVVFPSNNRKCKPNPFNLVGSKRV